MAIRDLIPWKSQGQDIAPRQEEHVLEPRNPGDPSCWRVQKCLHTVLGHHECHDTRILLLEVFELYRPRSITQHRQKQKTFHGVP